MKFAPGLAATACVLLFGALESSLAWNFAVWPGPDATQWAPSLGLTNVVAVAGGSDRTLFVRADGSIVWSWGGSWAGPTNAVQVSSYCHDLALLADSTVVEWGLGGCAGSAPYTTMPPGLTNVTAVAAGDRHSLVLKSDGTCASWGWMTVSAGFVPDGLSNVKAIAAGFDISGALKTDGSVVAWGYSGYGGTAAPGGLTDGMAIAMGHHHGLVLRSNGVVVAWGTTPPPDLTNVVKIAAQQTWSLVLKSDGHLAAWNDGIGSQQNVPTQPVTNVLAISAGSYHGVVLVGDGRPQPLWYLSNQVAIAGNSVTFTGEALGTEPLSYQWLFHGTNLPGAIYPTLTLSNLVPTQAGDYAVVVSNAFGIVTNSGASVTVAPFVITAIPTDEATVFGGDTFLNSVTAEGPSLSYQWRQNGVDLPGQTNTLLTVANVTTNEAGAYSVIVSNLFGWSESPGATLTVVPIAVVSQPADGSVYVGDAFLFTVGVQKNGPFSYQWRKDGADLPGETNTWLLLTNARLQDAGGYNVVAGNPYGSIESSTAMLAVVDSPPIFTKQPADCITWLGGSNTFQVSATGSKPLSYQWRLNGKDISGATNSALRISSASTNDLGTYSVLVSNVLGAGLSGSARLWLVPVVLWPDYALSVMPLSTALSNTVAVAAGNAFSLALRADGKVVAWGWNGEGETNVPPGLSNVTAVAAGDSHCLALRSNGTVVAWGSNAYGQAAVPANLSNVVAVAAGTWNSFTLRADGTAVGWGQFDYTLKTNAVPGVDWSGVAAIAAGQFHRLGLRPDGTVVGWLDYADYNLNRVPAGLTNVVALAAATRHSLALKADGTVIAWGDKTYGLTNPPAGLSNVVGIACGYTYNVALKADGTAVAWGFSENGQTNMPTGLGIFSAISASGHNLGLLATSEPVIIRAPRAVTAPPMQPVLLSVGAVSRLPVAYQWQLNGQSIPGATNASYRMPAVSQADQGNYVVVVSNELGVVTSAPAQVTVAGVLAWGWNAYAQTNVPPALTARAVAGGYGHSLALRRDGTIAAWGGGRSTAVTNVPASATNVIQIASGPYHSLALKSDGKVVAWGEAGSQLAVPANLGNVVAVAAGQLDSLALKSDGTVTHWGYLAPPPAWLSNVVSISAGYSFDLALRSDGTVVTWGAVPAPVGLSNVVAIAAASATAVALRTDGTVVTWGTDPLPPPPDLASVVAIAAGRLHLLALKSDGTVIAWGTNTYGQATAPPGWTNVAAIAGGYAHSLASVDPRDPLFVRQPASARAYSGNQLILSAGARSSLPLQFQWSFNGSNLPGATDACLSLPAVQATNSGIYALRAGNALGVVVSESAVVTVLDQKPFICIQPANIAVDSRTPALFQVVADGSEPKFYQWQKDGVSLDGATNASLNLMNLKRADEGLYSVIISNAFGTVTSTRASLRVMVPQQLQPPLLSADGSLIIFSGDSDGGLVSSADMPHFEVNISSNLVNWDVLTNALALTNGVLWFSDDPPTNHPQRFYRLRELP